MKLLRYISITILSHLLVCGLYAQEGTGGAGAGRPAVEPRDLAQLETLAEEAMNNNDRHLVIHYATQMQAHDDIDDAKLLDSYLLLISSYFVIGEQDSLKHYLDKALPLALATGDRKSLMKIYNFSGIYAVNIELDYYKGASYFLEGINLADEAADEPEYRMLLCNLATTYNLRNDPAGLEYALKLYEYGTAHNDSRLTAIGAYVSAASYLLLKQYEQALYYSEIAVSMADEYDERTNMYTQYANILLALGREKEAYNYYRKAVEYADIEIGTDPGSAVNAYLDYGRYLIGKRRYGDAIGVLEKGLNISIDKSRPVHRYKLYQNISDAYAMMGDYKNALDYYRSFHEEADSVFNVERERSINQLRIQYEAEKKELEIQQKEFEIQQNKLEILNGKRKLLVLTFILVSLAIALGATYILYRKKQSNYLQIVRQNQEALNKERWYQQRIESLLSKTDDKQQYQNKYSVSSLTDEKSISLFDDLNNLMTTQGIYKEQDLTKERVAKLLSTNRTYLSQVINEHTGLSFNYYIHSFRINEAVRVLSDPADDIPLKALAAELGFKSLSTFYKLFQATIGMPPSKYRETIKAKVPDADS